MVWFPDAGRCMESTMTEVAPCAGSRTDGRSANLRQLAVRLGELLESQLPFVGTGHEPGF